VASEVGDSPGEAETAMSLRATGDEPSSAEALAASCNPALPFNPPFALPVLNTLAVEYGPTLSSDELKIYFTSTRPGGPGGHDIYVATRGSTAAVFGDPAPLAGVNSAAAEWRPTLPADGLTIYFTFTSNGFNRIFRAFWSSATASFGAPAPVTALNSTPSTSNNYAPYVLPDHRAIYFISTRSSGGPQLYRAERTGDAFAPPVLVTVENLPGRVVNHPVVSADEKTLVFPSSDPGGNGDLDMWIATRSSITENFKSPTLLRELNTALHDQPGWLSPDGCTLYFSRMIDLDNTDIYVAHRPAR
jgi:hypothetical protein